MRVQLEVDDQRAPHIKICWVHLQRNLYRRTNSLTKDKQEMVIGLVQHMQREASTAEDFLTAVEALQAYCNENAIKPVLCRGCRAVSSSRDATVTVVIGWRRAVVLGVLQEEAAPISTSLGSIQPTRSI
jgi:hypothetical protein